MEVLGQASESKTPYGYIMLDVDYFKSINDTYGHQTGDEIIMEVADRLREFDKEGLKSARLGGDEFCAVFFDPNMEKAESLCSRIVDIMRKDITVSSGTLSITVSVGCALYPKDSEDMDRVMECADKALYGTKEKGRDGYTLFGRIDHAG